jgi:hypothetical protein
MFCQGWHSGAKLSRSQWVFFESSSSPSGQTRVESAMLGSLRDRIRNDEIRWRTKVAEKARRQLKWQWAGYIARLTVGADTFCNGDHALDDAMGWRSTRCTDDLVKLIPEVAETTQILLRDAVLSKLFWYEEYYRRDRLSPVPFNRSLSQEWALLNL